MPTRTLTAVEAAARLGIKTASLYAYVSRGQLSRTVDVDGKTSLFAAHDIDQLVAQRRRGRPANTAIDISVTTSLTRISDEGVWYRGVPLGDIVGRWSFERTAQWLWTGEHDPVAPQWPRTPAPMIGLSAVGSVDALVLLTALSAMSGPTRTIDPAGSAAIGRRLIASFADHAPAAAPKRPLNGSIAARLSARLPSRLPLRSLGPLIDNTLVLLADHDLASSTLAARIAASTRADGYRVVTSGLGVLAGPLHGAASRVAVELLDDLDRSGRPTEVVEAWRSAGRRLPGFGHKIYRVPDPRYVLLMNRLRQSGIDVSLIDEAVDVVADQVGIHPNIDLALAAMIRRCGFADGTGELLFGVARTAGWIAHAIEEYNEAPVRFRPRSVYVAPRPNPT